MATIAERRYTPEDLLAITDRPMPELVDGELVEREPMGLRADMVAAKIIRFLGNYSEALLPGVVNGSQGGYQIFPDDPRKVRIPDASFTRMERLPGGEVAEGHGRVAPDLVVEVISPNDLADALSEKLDDYLAAQVPLIWFVYPATRKIHVFTTSGAGPILRAGDILCGGDVLPGFECPVADLFS